MRWIEIIYLRSYTGRDREAALDAFRHMTPPGGQDGLVNVGLFRNMALENDLSIFIDWRGETPLTGKSRLGLQLADAFSEFGQIYHSVWSMTAESRLSKEIGR